MMLFKSNVCIIYFDIAAYLLFYPYFIIKIINRYCIYFDFFVNFRSQCYIYFDFLKFKLQHFQCKF